MSKVDKYKLLVPGPVSVRKDVLNCLSEDIKFHRSDEFRDLYKSVKTLAIKAFAADAAHDVLLITAAGTWAIESSIVSFIGKKDKVLVVNNGHFASRVEKILKVNNYNYQSFTSPWDEMIDYCKLEKRVKEFKPKFIICIALETSTGSLNSTESIGKIARNNGAIFFVDAVSGYFSEDINVNRDNIDICVTVSNKALEAPSGMAFIYFKKDLLKEKAGISLSLDLYQVFKSSQSNETPFTPNIPIFKSVERALEHYIQENRVNRAKRYKKHSDIVRRRLESLGASYYLKDRRMFSTAVTSISFKQEEAERMGRKLKEFGYIIWYKKYPEKMEGDTVIFQISVMGDLSTT